MWKVIATVVVRTECILSNPARTIKQLEVSKIGRSLFILFIVLAVNLPTAVVRLPPILLGLCEDTH